MKLNRRILLLIAPVILFSAAASSYIIYEIQKDALFKRTDSYLQLNMEKLAGHYRQTNSILSGYTYTLTKSDIIQRYFSHESNPIRELELIDNLQQTISSFQPKDDQFIALSILDAQKKPMYYTEHSDDPFATMDPLVLHHFSEVYDTTNQNSFVGYSENKDAEGILLRYEALDIKTLKPPLSYKKSEIIFVVVYSKLERFNQQRKELENSNKSSIYFSTKPTEKVGLHQSVELQSNFYANLDPAPYILQNKLHDIQKQLIIAFSFSALLTVLLLVISLYKHVIQPISRLDNQLKEVESNKRKNIEILDSKDEIGRLSARFYAMYSELEDAYHRTKILAERDHLTKLANRHQFQRHTEAVLTQEHIHVWVLYIDMDNFKYINDKYGHQIGDSLLISFANHIHDLCSEFNASHHTFGLASRLSGDEFAILLHTPFHQPDCADEFALKLLSSIQHRITSPQGSYPITASIGIATYPQDGDNIEKLLSNADTAMYQAKRAGKNQIAHYSVELDTVVQRRGSIERALRASNFDEEFSLVYQPYFTCKNCWFAGFEVLLRWESKSLGYISPEEFIPIAEQTGLFGTIDRWVVKKTFEQFSEVQSLFSKPQKLAVNLSSAELNSTQLSEYIARHTETYDVDPAMIEFEITETFASESQSFPLLHELSNLGFDLTIDDFGSGYTSISQLVQYPVQKIKLDRLFLDTLIASKKQQVIKPLIDLCHSQNMKVTAEGIESEEMNKLLIDYNCDYLQGFYFGRPMTLEELPKWIQTIKVIANDEASNHNVA
ncbi:putative bifunctional diguanylate cyclase/phosphodiesterase [Vibrio sp. RC27]